MNGEDVRVEEISRKSKEKRKIKEIYKESFPKEDRMPFWLMLIMAKTPDTDFLCFYDKDILCGFVYMATIENMTCILFFAVDNKIRSRGYGKRILDKIQSMYPDNKIILSIDRCDVEANDLEQRLRRKKFYLNNGYLETEHFLKIGNKKEQEILIKNGDFHAEEFSQFFSKYSKGTINPKIWAKTP